MARKQRASVMLWATVPCHDFLFPYCWNSHQGICLWVDAILNQGSGGGWWWCWGTIPRETKWAQSGVLKASPNKQCWLVFGRYCHVCPDAHTQTARRICCLQARSPDESSYSVWVTACLAKKTKHELQGCDVLTDGSLCVACRWLKPWWNSTRVPGRVCAYSAETSLSQPEL